MEHCTGHAIEPTFRGDLQVSAEVIDFFEARAAKLRKENSPLGRIFQELDKGPKLAGVTTKQMLQWADRLHNAKDNETMADVCADIEAILEGRG